MFVCKCKHVSTKKHRANQFLKNSSNQYFKTMFCIMYILDVNDFRTFLKYKNKYLCPI